MFSPKYHPRLLGRAKTLLDDAQQGNVGFETGPPLLIYRIPARKPGRKPLGDRAMTGAEKAARHRAKKSKTLPTQQRPSPGIAVPPPLRPAVPGFIIIDDGVNMDALVEQIFKSQPARHSGLRSSRMA